MKEPFEDWLMSSLAKINLAEEYSNHEVFNGLINCAVHFAIVHFDCTFEELMTMFNGVIKDMSENEYISKICSENKKNDD